MPEAPEPVPVDLPVSGNLRKTLRSVTERLREIYGSRLKRLILFGSQARGEATPESDVDVLAVLEGPVTAIEEAKRTSRVATKARLTGRRLSFVHMSEDEFADDRRPLIWSVREDGIDLLEVFSSDSPPIESSTLPEDRLSTR